MDTEHRSQPAGEIPRRFLQPLLLLVLERVGTSHGYELCESVRALGLSVDLAGVYRGLRSMEQRDLVTSQWAASESGPDRRLYSLTAAGQVAASSAFRELTTLRDALTAALAGFAVVARPDGS